MQQQTKQNETEAWDYRKRELQQAYLQNFEDS